MKKYSILAMSVVFCLTWNVFADDAAERIENGKQYFAKGLFESAAAEWEKARESVNPETAPGRYLDVSVHLARAYQSVGDYRKAIAVCKDAQPVADKIGDPKQEAQFHACVGDIYLAFGDMAGATGHIAKAIEKARASEDPRILAAILTAAGNLFTSDKDWDGAMVTYAEAIEHAETAKDSALLADAVLNAQYAAVMSGQYEMFDFAHALNRIQALSDDHSKAGNLIRLGLVLREIRNDLDEKELKKVAGDLTKTARRAFESAFEIAEKLGGPRMASQAQGYLGELYEFEKNHEQAFRATRRALFFAGQGHNPEILYLWQWQLGRLYNAIGDSEKAAGAFRASIETLNPIRIEMFQGRRVPTNTFNEIIKPVYLGLAEILIEQAETAADDGTRNKKLGEARDTMELLKTAELEDFFADECSTRMEAKIRSLDRAPEHTAIVYPIILPEKPAILLILPDGIICQRLGMDSKTLEKTAKEYRRQLQNRLDNRFMYNGEKLYDWIIRPVEPELERTKVETLVFAPDGALRTIPPSTFFDGKKFLVEKFAIVTVPALKLTDPRPFEIDGATILVSGLSEARQGFSPLPSVPGELKDVRKIMDGQDLLMNRDFTENELRSAFKTNEYTIFHMATHGVFGGTPKESFLLSSEGRLDMNRLESLIQISKFRENAVELLTLSACQTALGNERAALGLAGVAVKAGVRSAIATLWYVDDEATSIAIREFYRQLRKPGMSKARALQNAQKSLIARPRFWQPIYWAPFLLIGNWM